MKKRPILSLAVSLLRALRLMALFHPFAEFSAALGTIVLIYFGGRMVIGEVAARGCVGTGATGGFGHRALG